MTDGYVYFAYARSPVNKGISVKVGFSTQPQQRMKEIGAHLIAMAPGTLFDEAAVHDILTAYATGRNEWFRPGSRVYRIVHYVAKSGRLPDAILSAGDAKKRLVAAKREYRAAQSAISAFLSDDSNCTPEWSESPFRVGMRNPDIADGNWIPTPLPQTHGEG